MPNVNTMSNITLAQFDFAQAGYGHVRVIYTSPITGKKWEKVTNNTKLIDNTKNADQPKRKDLLRLMKEVKE